MPQNFARFCGVALAQLLHSAAASGDDRSVKIRSLEAAKIMKIKWLVLGCIEGDVSKKHSLKIS